MVWLERYFNACIVCGCTGGSQSYLLLCPVLLHWADLHLFSPSLASAASVDNLLRSLCMPAPICMRNAMSRRYVTTREPLCPEVVVCSPAEGVGPAARRLPRRVAVSCQASHFPARRLLSRHTQPFSCVSAVALNRSDGGRPSRGRQNSAPLLPLVALVVVLSGIAMDCHSPWQT